MRNLFKSSLVLVLLVAMFGTVSPTAQAQSEYDVTGCTLTVWFYSGQQSASRLNPDEFTMEVWDDGSLIYTQTVSGNPGDIIVFTFTTPRAIDQGAAGVGVQILWNGSPADYFEIPEWNPTGCEAAGCALDDGTYQGRLTVDKKLYWAADLGKQVEPATVIPAGKAVNIISTDAGFYKISWACGYYYITIDGVTVNQDPSAKPYLTGKGSNK